MKKFTLAALYWLLTLGPLAAEERYLVVLFAAQGADAGPRRSHTFATFMKVDVGEPDEDGEVPTEALETITISWMPASGSIRILARPEKGRNFDLQESLDWARDQGMQTSMRGPFEITRDIYERAVAQKERLESGQVAYKALDRRFRGGGATNCIHAVSDIVPGTLLFTGTARGDSATDLVALHFRPLLRNPERAHTWALRHLDTNGARIAVVNDSNVVPVSTPDFAE